MATTHYTVQKINGGSRWEVLADGHRVSKHNEKSNARERAEELKDRNDTLTIKDRNGNFQKRI